MKTQDVIDAYENWFDAGRSEQEKEFIDSVGLQQEARGFYNGYVAGVETLNTIAESEERFNKDVEYLLECMEYCNKENWKQAIRDRLHTIIAKAEHRGRCLEQRKA